MKPKLTLPLTMNVACQFALLVEIINPLNFVHLSAPTQVMSKSEGEGAQ